MLFYLLTTDLDAVIFALLIIDVLTMVM